MSNNRGIIFTQHVPIPRNNIHNDVPILRNLRNNIDNFCHLAEELTRLPERGQKRPKYICTLFRGRQGSTKMLNGRVISSVVTEGFDMDGDGTES